MSVPEATCADRIAGAIFGAAIGDAMGHPTEFLSLEQIHSQWGPAGVQGYELLWSRDGQIFAPYTDDTQMAEVVLRALIASVEAGEDLDACMRRIGAGFVGWAQDPQGGHRAPGNACLAGCRALARGVAWDQAGGASAGGCGSVMRAYPFGLLLAGDPEKAEAWAVAHSRLTHADPIALAACAAMTRGLIAAQTGLAVDAVAASMIAAAGRHSPPTAEMIRRAADEARFGVPVEVSLDRLRGWAANEAMAAAAYVFVRHPDDARAAILEGANTPGDSDSIATLAGALVGARVGLSGLPEAWVQDVERSQALLALAGEAARVSAA